MSPKSFSFRTFLPDGDADGVKIIAKSKWTGRCMVIPRALIAREIGRAELDAPGLYVLIGPADESALPGIRIGSGDPLSTQLEQHAAKSEFWTWAVTFSAKKGRLSQPHIAYLEANLVQLARAAKTARLLFQSTPSLPTLSTEDQAEVELFLEHLLSICPLLGLNAFEKPLPGRPYY